MNKTYLSVAKSHIVFVKLNIACVKIVYILKKEIFAGINPFVPNAPFFCPLKTSEDTAF